VVYLLRVTLILIGCKTGLGLGLPILQTWSSF
ncbi:LOW QUALITY PROTEIN: hypothetical protein PanWU01x14_113380, partial [Parasponia andersonii]